jgi:hypothetical protein
MNTTVLQVDQKAHTDVSDRSQGAVDHSFIELRYRLPPSSSFHRNRRRRRRRIDNDEVAAGELDARSQGSRAVAQHAGARQVLR